MRWITILGSLTIGAWIASRSIAADGNRLTYLDGRDPYYVSQSFAKLTTPQWIDERGVEAVVVLAIDDMRDPERYEAFLRPILERLKQIDGRAPVSIMTCSVDPQEPRLQQLLAEGVSIETHTIDHPCPLLAGGDFAKAKSTFDRCVDLINSIPGNRPVAFRVPCCDSLNTPSPRFFAEIFNQTTPKGNFLSIDTSVFNLTTPNDPALPRELVLDSDGTERFRKYLPADRTFVNTIENYPYPYVLGRLCWEFPCVVPSDWEAQHLQKPFNPRTVRDMQAAIDATVVKRGVFDLVFHPHGWIRNDQVVELIDHALERHGRKVKFLCFREAQDRLNRHLLAGQPLRDASGGDNGVRLLDLNDDGYLDVVIGNDQLQQTRLWSPDEGQWVTSGFPVRVVEGQTASDKHETGVRFGIVRSDGFATMIVANDAVAGAWHFDGTRWVEARELLSGLELAGELLRTAEAGRDRGVRLRDLDGDGRCELILSNPQEQAIFRWSSEQQRWIKLPFVLPEGATVVDDAGHDAGLRFVDIDEDGHDDVLFSDDQHYLVALFTSMEKGWSKVVRSGRRGDPGAIPAVVRGQTDNGMWFHSGHLWVQNEDTSKLPDLVDRRNFRELLSGRVGE